MADNAPQKMEGLTTPALVHSIISMDGILNQSISSPNAQGDGPQGTATSPPFLIMGTKVTFLIGGGSDINVVRLELLIGGVLVDKTANTKNVVTMEQQEIDTSSLKGQVSQVRIVDNSSGGCGFIYVDHIQDSCT
ncbi:hypothetical protein AC249_AIPGENE29065 [Exaiptasia diaphana]|nr:hypothetical protein AC249_AIPGENE29065 [Exaiptasia diaphana]